MADFKLERNEGEVKLAVAQYLEYGQNQGKWLFLRLQSGELIAMAGETRRRIKLCPPGTADFVVLQGATIRMSHMGRLKGTPHPVCRVTFIECKSSTGKQRPEQVEFQGKAEAQRCRYFIVRDASELNEILVGCSELLSTTSGKGSKPC